MMEFEGWIFCIKFVVVRVCSMLYMVCWDMLGSVKCMVLKIVFVLVCGCVFIVFRMVMCGWVMCRLVVWSCLV